MMSSFSVPSGPFLLKWGTLVHWQGHGTREREREVEIAPFPTFEILISPHFTAMYKGQWPVYTSLFVANNVGRTIKEETNTRNIGGWYCGNILYPDPQYLTPEVYIVGCNCFSWMRNTVHLRDFWQSKIKFMPSLHEQFQIQESNI